MRWSKTEASRVVGAKGKRVYVNGAMLLAPWAQFETSTPVRSEESSGGFDIQLQIGASF